MTRPTSDSTEKLIADFNTVIADTEQLLRSVAANGGDKASAMRAGVEKNLEAARQRLRQLQDSALEKGRDAVRAGDEYVHENPWESIGVAVGVAAVAGIFIGLLLSRR